MAGLLISLQRPSLQARFILTRPFSSATFIFARCLSTPSTSFQWRRHNTIQLSQSLRQLRTSAVRSNSPAPNPSDVVVQPLPESEVKLAEKKVPEDYVYYGPMAPTFRRLKIFSLSSLTLSFVVTPFMFVIPTTSSLPLVAKFALAAVALSTSGISTGLVGWFAKPYVSILRWIPLPDSEPQNHPEGHKKVEIVEMTTHTLGLHPRITRVYDPSFLVPTSRPFAKWELAEVFRMPAAEAELEKKKGTLPRDETVAETMDIHGGIIGRWVVKWDGDGVGTCHEVGKIVRYFNVHEEVLERPLR